MRCEELERAPNEAYVTARQTRSTAKLKQIAIFEDSK
jgi:hypothetical protein